MRTTGQGRSDVDTDDVEVLQVMTEVRLASAGRTGSRVTSVTEKDLETLSTGIAVAVQVARSAVDGLEVLGPTRFGFAKRAVLRLSRLVTHKVAEADRALADGLEALAIVQRGQTATVQRANDQLRALVVSADLAISDALDELAERDTAQPAAERLAELEATVTDLGRRIAELERRDGQEPTA